MAERAAKDLIRDGIDALGISQKQFAKAVGVDPATVSRWLRGTQVPRSSLVGRLAETMGVDEVELWRAIAAAQHDENRELRKVGNHYDAALAEMREIVEVNRDINEQIGRDIAAIRSEIRDLLTAILDTLTERPRPKRP